MVRHRLVSCCSDTTLVILYVDLREAFLFEMWGNPTPLPPVSRVRTPNGILVLLTDTYP